MEDNKPEQAADEMPKTEPTKDMGAASADSAESVEPSSSPEGTSPPTESQDQVAVGVVTSDPAPTKKPGRLKQLGKKKLLLVVCAVLILGGGIAFYLYKKSSSQKPSSNSSASTNNSQITDEEKNEAIELAPIQSVDGSTYLSKAKKLDDLKMFKNLDFTGSFACDDMGQNCKSEPADTITYYQVGTTKSGSDILVFFVPGGISDTEYFALGKGGKYQVLLAVTNYGGDEATSMKKSANANTTIDTTTKLGDLSFPTDLEVGGQKVITTHDKQVPQLLRNGLASLTDTANEKGVNTTKRQLIKVADSGNKVFYRNTTLSANDTYQLVTITATLGNLFSMQYKLNGELTKNSDKALALKWQSGEKNTSIYFTGGPGCGSGQSYVIADKADKKQLTQIGTSPQGQKVYQLPITNALVKELYDKDYNKGEYLDNASLKNLTIQQFADKHAYFIVENGYNELVVLQRDDMFVRGGCAKPVVYLYPTVATVVSVQVGANVTASDPLYPVDGWQNVLAQPSGNLRYQGRTYGSLFWEGYGHGVYPEITSGSIVPTNQAIQTIRQQLRAQGLNDKETQDFLEFWTPKLPKTPFVRLSWLSKQQLDALAPLTINPRPDTTIRVFLDFEGLNKPYSLPVQKLRTPARNGFTAVEWGGLARDGSVPKMR